MITTLRRSLALLSLFLIPPPSGGGVLARRTNGEHIEVEEGPPPIVCPADACICPDGSGVGRDSSDGCSFKRCVPGGPRCGEDNVGQDGGGRSDEMVGGGGQHGQGHGGGGMGGGGGDPDHGHGHGHGQNGGGMGMGNPASSHCAAMGGEVDLGAGSCTFHAERKDDGGPDLNSACDEWSVYRGECQVCFSGESSSSASSSTSAIEPTSVSAAPPDPAEKEMGGENQVAAAVRSSPEQWAALCEGSGGSIEQIQSSDGATAGMCAFPDGSMCKASAFFAGECAVCCDLLCRATRHCEENGGEVVVRGTDSGGKQWRTCRLETGANSVIECEAVSYLGGGCRPGRDSGSGSGTGTGSGNGSIGMGNPASMHCHEMGGKVNIINDEGDGNGESGRHGMCHLPDGTICEEWSLFRGQCGPDVTGGSMPPDGSIGMGNPASTFCLRVGGRVETESDENGERGICTFRESSCEEWALFRGECVVCGGESSAASTAAESSPPNDPNPSETVEERSEVDRGEGGNGESIKARVPPPQCGTEEVLPDGTRTCVFRDGSRCDREAFLEGRCSVCRAATHAVDPVMCPEDLRSCPDGFDVGRDRSRGCVFKPCPGEDVGAEEREDGGGAASTVTISNCDDETMECPDGTVVGKDPGAGCEFRPCNNVPPMPDDSSNNGGAGCPEDAFVCTDGSAVGRDPDNDCEFFPCPTAGDDGYEGGPAETAEGQREGPIEPISGEDCEDDTRECPGGMFLVRDADNNCEFPPCPEVTPGCAEDRRDCPEGGSVGRDPYNDCQFSDCPDGVGVLGIDTFSPAPSVHFNAFVSLGVVMMLLAFA